MQLEPSVVNNPKDPKHEVLPTDLFMPGKHPNEAKQADIQALVRLIHRETNADPHCTKYYRSLTFAKVVRDLWMSALALTAAGMAWIGPAFLLVLTRCRMTHLI